MFKFDLFLFLIFQTRSYRRTVLRTRSPQPSFPCRLRVVSHVIARGLYLLFYFAAVNYKHDDGHRGLGDVCTKNDFHFFLWLLFEYFALLFTWYLRLQWERAEFMLRVKERMLS